MKGKKIAVLVTVITSITLLAAIVYVIFNMTGKVNQGSYRISDLVIKSTLEIIEKENVEEMRSISDIKFDADQNNNILMLVSKEFDAESMYIDKVSIKKPEKAGNISFVYNVSDEETIDLLKEEKTELPIILKENDYIINLNVNNYKMLVDTNLNTELESVVFDGSILKILNINISSVVFEVKFNLHIVEKSGKVNVCKFKFKIPSKELIENGISVERKEASDYPFSIM